MAKRYFPNTENNMTAQNELSESEVKPMHEEIVSELPAALVYGYVTCGRLNIRTEPAYGAEVLCVVENDAELMISPDDSTEEWYAVTTSAGIEGYCIKKFICLER